MHSRWLRKSGLNVDLIYANTFYVIVRTDDQNRRQHVYSRSSLCCLVLRYHTISSYVQPTRDCLHRASCEIPANLLELSSNLLLEDYVRLWYVESPNIGRSSILAGSWVTPIEHIDPCTIRSPTNHLRTRNQVTVLYTNDSDSHTGSSQIKRSTWRIPFYSQEPWSMSCRSRIHSKHLDRFINSELYI